MDLGIEKPSVGLRLPATVACSTLVLTAAFVGLLALVRGGIADVGGRLPFYVLGSAVVFVVALFTREDPRDAGIHILTTTIGIGVAAFVVISFAGEGAVYAVNNGGDLLTSQLIIYFVAAALICTAIAYWLRHHWREFVE